MKRETICEEFEVESPKIIEWIDTVTVPATKEKFVAKEKFVKDSKEVKFSGFCDNFNDWFLEGKIEEPLGEQKIHYGNLTRDSSDGLIMEELGGETKVETTLTGFYYLLKRQGNGEKGVLLTDKHHGNIFYIPSTSDVLRAIGIRWRYRGWQVAAFFVEHSGDWGVGNRVFSANSEIFVP